MKVNKSTLDSFPAGCPKGGIQKSWKRIMEEIKACQKEPIHGANILKTLTAITSQNQKQERKVFLDHHILFNKKHLSLIDKEHERSDVAFWKYLELAAAAAVMTMHKMQI